MKAPALLLAALALPLAAGAQTAAAPQTAASAQASATARQAATGVRATTSKGTARNGVLPPDPDLFDGSKMEAEKRQEYGMIGDFEMPGSDTPDNSQAGGQQGQPGQQQQGGPQAASPAGGGASGAQQQQQGGAGGAQQAAAAGGGGGGGDQSIAQNDAAAGGGGDQGQEGAQGAGGAAGGKSGAAGGKGGKGGSGPAGKAEGMQAAGLSGPQNAASQDSIPQGSRSGQQIGSAELRIDTTDVDSKDVVGRETTPGGTQGSNKAMPAGKGGQGSNNQNMGVEKGRVIPKGL